MMIIKANDDSEAGVLPEPGVFEAMGRYNEEMVKAGVMLAGEGLHPSSKGARVEFSQGDVTVTDGPFAETKEMIAGFWLIQVGSKEEAIEWAKRCPASNAPYAQLELRQVAEASDFADHVAPETLEREERLRDQVGQA
jgi:hypothetical protein